MRGSVLVVEDSPTQAEALRSVLAAVGFEVALASSGEEAVEKLSETRFDIVVSDVMMPGMSGYELCRIVKSRFESHEIPVVLLTSLTDPMAIIRGLECGADNYVTKPYTPEHLITRIRHALDKYSLRPARRASMGVNVSFLGSTFVINSEREQILDLFLSSIEDVVRTNEALIRSQRQLADAQRQLEAFASRMQREASVNAEKYATLMRNAADAILVVDGGGKIEEANERAAELLDESSENLRGRRLAEFMDSEARAVLEEPQSGTRGSSARATDIEFRHRSGRRVFVDLTVSRTGTGRGGPALVILHDVTERREAEKRIRRSEAQLAVAQRVAGLGSFERDLAAQDLRWSDQMANIFQRVEGGAPTLDALAARIHPHDESKFREALNLPATAASGHECVCRVMRPDGTIRHVELRSEVHRNANGDATRIIGTALDVTERKLLEEQLLHAQKMEAIGQLAGGIAHDFNNLITVIASYCDITMAALDKNSPLREDIAQIQRAAESAAALTRQLLAFSRRQVIQAQPISLSSTAHGLKRMLERLLGDDITLECDFDDSNELVMADPSQIEQVVLNLAVNARDAMPEGGCVRIRTRRVDISEQASAFHAGLAPGAYVVLAVEDEGSGMDMETQARIFEPFFTTKPTGQGTGLGLSTVYGITKQSGGDVTVKSAPGEGTTFNIYLPAIAGTAAASHAAAAPAPAPHTTTSTTTTGEQRRARRAATTLMLVEDEPAVRSLFARVLRKEGYHVLEAPSGAAAVELAEQFDKPIDLVITDVVMPDTNGPAMVERLAAKRKEIKVIFVSGYTHDDILRRGLADRDVTFLPKPFIPRQLIELVQEVLG